MISRSITEVFHLSLCAIAAIQGYLKLESVDDQLPVRHYNYGTQHAVTTADVRCLKNASTSENYVSQSGENKIEFCSILVVPLRSNYHF